MPDEIITYTTKVINSLYRDVENIDIYNPFSGLASFKTGINNSRFIAQEINQTTSMLSYLRLSAYGVNNYSLFSGDSIKRWNPCDEKYDVIISNPPYINNIDYNNLDVGVKGYEPKMALNGGIDGLRIIEKVIKKSRLNLKNNGLLAIEIGFGQSIKVKKILRENGFYILKTVKDLQSISRCLIAKKIR